jgi:branched-subunit amino acid transport protein AzlD
LKKTRSPIQNYFRFMRSINGEDQLENFLVSAVASVLVIRLYLSLTGFPQLNAGGLHIAHMLWGGLLMFIAIFMALGFLSKPAHEWAAVLGGIGFGAFIDELGKFLTQDNNYFFQPAIALIYLTFVAIYIAIRSVFNYRPLSPREKLANVFELIKQGSINGLNKEEQQTLLSLLDQCDVKDPYFEHLKEMLDHVKIIDTRRPHALNRLKSWLDDVYQKIITRWWFGGVVITFFGITAITGIAAVIGIVEWPWNLILGIGAGSIILLALLQFWKSRIPNLQIPLSVGIVSASLFMAWAVFVNRSNIALPFAEWAQLVTSSMTAILIMAGSIFMARSRLAAYMMYHRAILVSILLTQIFAFYQYQFYALFSLTLNILILFGLRYMITRERLRVQNGKS